MSGVVQGLLGAYGGGAGEEFIVEIDIMTSTASTFNIPFWSGAVPYGAEFTPILDGVKQPKVIISGTGNYMTPSLSIGWHKLELVSKKERGWLCPLGTGGGSGLNDMRGNGSNHTFEITGLKWKYLIPFGITTLANSFGSQMFSKSKMTNLYDSFDDNPGITSVGPVSFYGMFSECKNLWSLGVFNLPQSISSVGASFLSYGFYKCSSLETMPSGFNLPPGISGNVAGSFLRTTRYGCTNLLGMPAGFAFPAGITQCTTQFMTECRYDCASFSTANPKLTFIFPNITSGSNYARDALGGTNPLKNLYGETPAKGTTIYIHIPN